MLGLFFKNKILKEHKFLSVFVCDAPYAIPPQPFWLSILSVCIYRLWNVKL